MFSRALLACAIAVAALCLSCVRSASTYITRGNQFYQRGKFEDASLNYRKAIRQDPNLAEGYYRLALSLLKENKSEEVLPNLTRAQELSPNNIAAKETLADLLLSLYLNTPSRPKTWYDQLIKLSDDLLSNNANSYQGHRVKGYLAFLESKPEEALAHFQRAAHVAPELALMIAQSAVLGGRHQEGEQQARAIIDSDPDYAPAYDFLCKQLESEKKYSDCEALLKLKRAKNPKQAAYAVQLAEFYHRHGEASQRDAVLQDLLRNPKAPPDGAMLVGDFDSRIGESKSAVEAFQTGLRSHPEKAREYLTRISSILVEQHDAKTAVNLVEQYLAGHDDSDLKILRASLVIEAGQTQKVQLAVAALVEGVKKFPDDARLHFELGRGYLFEGKLNEAQSEFKEAVRQNSRFLEPRLQLVLLSLNTRQYEDALRQSDEILSIAPREPGASVFRAASLTGLGRYQEARSTLKDLSAVPGQGAAVAVELGFLSLMEKNYADAELAFRQNYKPGAQDVRPLAGLVAALKQQGKWDAAIRTLEQDLSAGPDRPFAALMLAQVMAEKHPDQAIEQLEHLVASKPQFSPALMALGDLYLRTGQPEKAVTPLEHARDLNPASSAPLVLLSASLERTNKVQQAKQVYGEWLKLEPDNPIALNNLAYLECETGGDLDKALQLARHALDKSPKDANISDTIGWIYLKRQMYSSAGSVFEHISQQYPHNASFRFHNALAYLGSGNKIKAKSELEAALSVNPPSDVAGKIKQTLHQVQANP